MLEPTTGSAALAARRPAQSPRRMPSLRYGAPVPAPTKERKALERELREELPAQLAAYRRELAAGQADKTRREWLEW